MSAVWHWLVSNGLYRFVVGAIFGFFWGEVMGIRKHLKKQSDALDTNTPGGLHDVVTTLESAVIEAGKDKNESSKHHPRLH